MRLEQLNIYINEVHFSHQTCVKNNVLFINREEIVNLLLEDERLSRVAIELAVPGEDCRIVRAADIIEPRIKVNSRSQVFPGPLSAVNIVGEGQTLCLKGVAVVETWQLPSEMNMIVDMSGPAAELSMFSRTLNVVLIAHPKPGVSRREYANALKKASLKTAAYLAKAAKDVPPDEIIVYDLDLTGKCKNNRNLPRVAYICQLYSHGDLMEPLVYGHNARGMMPTVMHPNEFFDGAIINFQYDSLTISEVTYSFQNHPVIKELYNRHEKELFFTGVILKDAPSMLDDKTRAALLSAKLARWELGAEGVILTKEGGGHPQVDLALTCEKCEELGIKSVILLTEFLSTTGIIDETIIFNSSAADAIVSCGMSEGVNIPPRARVLGDELIEPDKYPEHTSYLLSGADIARKGGTVANLSIRGALSQFGDSYLTTIEF